MSGVPRRFWLVQPTALTGTDGIVAEGTKFSDGSVVLSEPGCRPSCWDSAESMLASHRDAAVHWLDTDRLLSRCLI